MTCTSCQDGICTSICMIDDAYSDRLDVLSRKGKAVLDMLQAANDARAADLAARIEPRRESILRDLAEDELSVARIVEKHELSEYAIERVARDAEIDLRARADRIQAAKAAERFPIDEDAILGDLRDNKLTAPMICERHGVGVRRLRRIAREHDINMRQRANSLDLGKGAEEQDEWQSRWMERDSLSGRASLNALRLPFGQIAKAMEAV